MEEFNAIRKAIFESLSLLLQTLEGSDESEIFFGFIERLSEDIATVATDPTGNAEVLKATAGLLGDIVQTFQQRALLHLKHPKELSQILYLAMISLNHQTRELGHWAKEVLVLSLSLTQMFNEIDPIFLGPACLV